MNYRYGEVLLAKSLGYNTDNREQLFGNEADLFYFIAKFRMDFIFEKTSFHYKTIIEQDIKDFYNTNHLLFKKEDGDYFPYDEVKLVIRKKLRSIEYEEAVNDILR